MSIISNEKSNIKTKNQKQQWSTLDEQLDHIVYSLGNREMVETNLNSVNETPPATEAHSNTIIIVEDDEVYGKVLSYQLRAKGFHTLLSTSGKKLFELIKQHGTPDLFILDYYLGSSEPTGLDLCRKLKSYTSSPVIMLTGNQDVDTLVSCLNAGAEQYIVKPCDIRELIARIEVTLRNHKAPVPQITNSFLMQIDEDISLDGEEDCIIHTNGSSVKLTQKETALLELFLQQDNRFISRNKAFQTLYGFDMDPLNRSIDVLVSRLRKKINEISDDYRIKNLRGNGYVLYKKGQNPSL